MNKFKPIDSGFQNLYCHSCDRTVIFKLDMKLNGNHIITCPHCKHEHCRVVEDGIVTSDRWDTRNTINTIIYKALYTADWNNILWFIR